MFPRRLSVFYLDCTTGSTTEMMLEMLSMTKMEECTMAEELRLNGMFNNLVLPYYNYRLPRHSGPGRMMVTRGEQLITEDQDPEAQ